MAFPGAEIDPLKVTPSPITRLLLVGLLSAMIFLFIKNDG
jgi:hypothetical protein